MRIQSDVEVSNRLLPSFNMKAKSKAMRAQVSVGRKPGDHSDDGELFLMICTKQDRNGTKYRLKNNIEQFFVKFVNDGKATIRFSSPPHDLCLSKADPVQLKGLLSIVKLGIQGKAVQNVTLSTLAPASTKQVEKLRTRMTVMSRKDYPLTSNFPSSLRFLQVSQCALKRFDSRMLKLRQLQVLDLSNNSIQSVPENFDSMDQLSELRLANNQISDIPEGFCTGNLQKSLRLLDLSSNHLKILKPHFCNLAALGTLKLDSNQLLCLPRDIGKLQNLRTFSASKNQLKTLPPGFAHLNFSDLDLFGNPFLNGSSVVEDNVGFPSLLEYTARAIKRLKVAFGPADIPGNLVSLLNNPKYCLCGETCFQHFLHYKTRFDLHRIAASVVAVDQSGCMHVPVEGYLCSAKCRLRYQRNPSATLWK